MVKFTNSNILSAFRKQMGISKADEIVFVEAFQSIFEEALFQDKILKINGLGTFKLILVESRKSVNVNTGEKIEIAGHYKLTFTPDATLKYKVNEPFAHLEIVELDSNVVVEKHNETSAATSSILSQNDYIVAQEVINQQDDPLQKLAEQAIELKDIIADIQGFSVQNNTIEQVEEIQVEEVKKEEMQKENEVEETKIEENKKETKEEINSSVTSDLNKKINQELESISARDIVAEINREDIAPSNKKSKFWIWIAVLLGLSIIGLLVYQNRDFFVLSEDVIEETIPVEEIIIVEESSEIETIEAESSNLNLSDSTNLFDNDSQFSNLSLNAQEPVVVNPQIDMTSPLYSDKFSDLFNIKREHTEFIDTVVLNEGSRLTWISLKQYGHRDYWVYIYEANRDIIKNPNSIKIGTKLRIPRLAPELIDTTNPETIEYARYLHDIYVEK